MSKVALETERLLLREITHDDFDDMHAFWSDAEVMRYFPRTLDEEAMRAWIEGSAGKGLMLKAAVQSLATELGTQCLQSCKAMNAVRHLQL